MKKNFIPYGRHHISEEDIQKRCQNSKSSHITQGSAVPEFEENISKKVLSKYSICVNSATSALHLACLALEVQKEILYGQLQYLLSHLQIRALYCGAKIDFVDINPLSGLVDVDNLEFKLKDAFNKDKLPKVFIPVHLAGTSCDMERIYDLSKKYGFSIIEDASHAVGGTYQDKPVGSCAYSSITVFSFHPVKIITSGEGGAATTNDPKIAEKLKMLRSHGIVKEESKFMSQKLGSWYYEQQSLGFNYRMNDIQASLGLSQLKRLEIIVKERNRQLDFYKNIFSELPITFLEVPPLVYSSVHLAIIRLNDQVASKYFDLFEGLINSDIGVQLHYFPIYRNPLSKI